MLFGITNYGEQGAGLLGRKTGEPACGERRLGTSHTAAAFPDSFIETQLTHNKSFIVNMRVLKSFDTWLHLRNHQLGRDNIPY